MVPCFYLGHTAKKDWSKTAGGWALNQDWGVPDLGYDIMGFDGEKKGADTEKSRRDLHAAEKENLPTGVHLTAEDEVNRREAMIANGMPTDMTPVEKVQSVTYPAGEEISFVAAENMLKGLGKVGKAIGSSLPLIGAALDVLGDAKEAY